MAETNWKAKAQKLKKRLKALKKRLADEAAVATAASAVAAPVKPKAAKPVSPLAPKDGFPALPRIAGVEFAAVEAGIKYKNRKDVMLIRLAPGQKVRMLAVGTPEPLTGTVRLVEPTIDTTTRLGRARISIDDASKVRSGMFMDAEILVAERETLSVPVTAVGSSAEGTTVMKVTDGTVARVPVRTGIRDGGWIEILEGVAAGDTDKATPAADAPPAGLAPASLPSAGGVRPSRPVFPADFTSTTLWAWA